MEGLPAALCLFDLDNLKCVNDTCGHDKGDRMIEAFASLLRRMTRAEDIQCRYGGDEFIVILKNLADKKVVMQKCRDICRSFSEILKEERMQGSCSCGVAVCGADENFMIEWIERADQALYCAKRENKGGCCMWSDEPS